VAELSPEAQLVDRFGADLDALVEPAIRIGLAVSGGADSLALLLLAAAARPGKIEAATVDHGLRLEAVAEAEMVAQLCQRLEVPHTVLQVEWDVPPSSAIQELAREVRYGALAAWMRERSLGALVTGHQLDDQAETLVMRLARGSGVRGLKGMRASSRVPGHPDLKLLRPLLGWRRCELERICAAAGLEPAADPSNFDEQFERVRIRRALADADLLPPQALARSAANLAAADEALDWAAGEEWRSRVDQGEDEIRYRPSDAPAEVRRRVVSRAITRLASEGARQELRGRELDRLLAELEASRTATLRGVRCSGGTEWRFAPAGPRRRSGQ
jgi:tRNA(Ile)-lysidine synthase